MVNLVTVPNVELMKVGKWDLSSGELDVTPDMITQAVQAHDASVLRKPTIRLGHNDPRFSGDPAVGYVDNLRASADGQTLLGDLIGLPEWLGNIMPSAYPDRSIEALIDYTTPSGSEYPFVLTGLALLGASMPGIRGLESLQGTEDIARLYDIAAAGKFGGTAVEFTVTAASDDPYGDVDYADPGYQDDKQKRYPLDTADHVRSAWSYINMPKNAGKYSSDDLSKVKTRIKTAAKKFGIEINAASPAAEKKGAVMASQREKLAALLGLDESADDDAVDAALDEAITQRDNPPAPPEPVAPPAPPAPSIDQVAAVAAEHGLTVVATADLQSLRDQAAAGEAARAQQIREADERTVRDALTSGRITAAGAQTWREQLAKSRETTLALLAAMPENRAMAVAELGYGVASEDTSVDPEMETMLAKITGQPIGKA